MSGKAWHNVVNLEQMSKGLTALGRMQNCSYSFVLKFKGRPSGKIIGSTQWTPFFPQLTPSTALIIEVSRASRSYFLFPSGKIGALTNQFQC